MVFELAREGRAAGGDGREVTGADVEGVVVLEEKRPFRGVDLGRGVAGGL